MNKSFNKPGSWGKRAFAGCILSSCVCLNGLSTKYRSYLLKLVYICGHFLTVNNRRYGRCCVNKSYLCVLFLNFTLIYRQIQQDRFQMLFKSVQWL